jgi:hypothetical protein
VLLTLNKTKAQKTLSKSQPGRGAGAAHRRVEEVGVELVGRGEQVGQARDDADSVERPSDRRAGADGAAHRGDPAPDREQQRLREHIAQHQQAVGLQRADRGEEQRVRSYEEQRGIALQDWKDTTMSEQRSAAVREMARKYTVQTAPAKP